ncbi:MAG TPA: efflux RND transporter periplasmic adaptor subunit [Fibrobacteria bacterium]|nr:efflux RND transporter periplasmic adaptor subunit [Fibrobacteria bacterium]
MNSKTMAFSLSVVAFLSSCKQQPQTLKASDGTVRIQAVHALWHCPMHPQIVRDHPGNCPICGMQLVPFPSDATSATGDSIRPGAGIHASHDVMVDPAEVRKIGVRTDIVEAGTLGPELRVDAEGVLDEAAELSVTVRTMGYLETVAPVRTGDRVRKGQILATFYSPEVVAAQGEWLQAAKTGDSTAAQAGRERLRSYGWPESMLDRIAAGGTVVRALPLTSPADGWISKRQADQGQATMAGQELFRIVQGSGVLVDAQVPQSRLPGLSTGSAAEISGSDLAVPVKAVVRSILPVVGAGDRTATVRLEVRGANPLRVGGLYQTQLHPKLETGLVVPDASVLHTGTRDIVFLALGGGRFRPQKVETGPSEGGKTLVRQGLEAGDEVVVSAQFLLDGESRLQAVLDQMDAR